MATWEAPQGDPPRQEDGEWTAQEAAVEVFALDRGKRASTQDAKTV
jgi:hypothetical protein